MQKQITITFQHVPEGMGDAELQQCVRTALCDYWSRRNPPVRYVADRYGSHPLAFRADVLPRIERAVALTHSFNLSEPVAVNACPFCGCTEPYVERAPGAWPSCPQCNGV